MAKHPAAFINEIVEMRDFGLAIKHLQETWDELCDARQSLRALLDCSRAIVGASTADPNADEAFNMFFDAVMNARHEISKVSRSSGIRT